MGQPRRNELIAGYILTPAGAADRWDRGLEVSLFERLPGL